MKDEPVDYLGPSIVGGKPGRRGRFNQGSMVSHLELTVERAPQGGRTCRPCAVIGGRYSCQPSAAVHREWRHTEPGMDLILSLIQREPGTDPRMRAMILVEVQGRVHARAIYYSEPLSAGLLEGPWMLKMVSEESECDFVFPGQVEIVSSGKLSAPVRASR